MRAIAPSWRARNDGSPPPTSTTRRAVLPVMTRVVKRCAGPNASRAFTPVTILVLDAGIWRSSGVRDQRTCPVAGSVTSPARSGPRSARCERTASLSATAWSLTDSGSWSAAAAVAGASTAAVAATATRASPRRA